jgi:hypothetical protein
LSKSLVICKKKKSSGELIADDHHLFWPKEEFVGSVATELEREFRALPCCQVRTDVFVHMLIHGFSEPPSKPTNAEMRYLIRRHNLGECNCSQAFWLTRTRILHLPDFRTIHYNAVHKVDQSCMLVTVDAMSYEYLKRHRPASWQPSERRQSQLEERHRYQECACYHTVTPLSLYCRARYELVERRQQQRLAA